MATTITVPACGWKMGTCGWLAAGLADGSIRVAPGTTRKGGGGLWIYWTQKDAEHQGCLAIWNEFNLTDSECSGAESFAPPCNDFAGTCPLTPAAERFLLQLTRDWCDEANTRRANDEAEMPVVEIR